MTLLADVGWVLVHSLWQIAVLWGLHALWMRRLAEGPPASRYRASFLCLVLMLAVPLATLAVVRLHADHAPTLGVATAMPGAGRVAAGEIAAWLTVAWVAGVVVQIVRTLVALAPVTALLKAPGPTLSADLAAIVERVSRSACVRRAVRVVEVHRFAAPVTVGLLRPVIFVPAGLLLGLTPRQAELVLAHEFAHIRRCDFLANLVQVIIEHLLFFHPLVHAVSARLREERELCCDAEVMGRYQEPLPYARALATLVAGEAWAASRAGRATLSAAGSSIARRIGALDPPPASGRRRVAANGLPATGLLAAAAVMIALGGQRPPDVRAPLRAVSSPGPVAPVPATRRLQVAYGERPVEWTAAGEPGSGGRIVAGASAPEDTAVRLAAGARSVGAGNAPRPGSSTGAPTAGPLPGAAAVVVPTWPETAVTSSMRTGTASRAVMESVSSVPLPLPVAGAANAPSMAGGVLLFGPTPRYPSGARLRGYGDVVTATFTVNGRGEVTELRVDSDAGRPEFRRSVSRALARWRYEPLVQAGVTVVHERSEIFHFTMSPNYTADDAALCPAGRNVLRVCTPGDVPGP